MPFLIFGGIICGPHRGSFAVRDHFRPNLGIICGWGSFAALYSTSVSENQASYRNMIDYRRYTNYFYLRPWGPFLESPGNLMGPASHFEISLKKSMLCSDL